MHEISPSELFKQLNLAGEKPLAVLGIHDFPWLQWWDRITWENPVVNHWDLTNVWDTTRLTLGNSRHFLWYVLRVRSEWSWGAGFDRVSAYTGLGLVYLGFAPDRVSLSRWCSFLVWPKVEKSLVMQSNIGSKQINIKMLNIFLHKSQCLPFCVLVYVIYKFCFQTRWKEHPFPSLVVWNACCYHSPARHFHCRKWKAVSTSGRPQISPGSSVSLTVHWLQKLVNSKGILYSLSPGINLSKFCRHYCHQVRR